MFSAGLSYIVTSRPASLSVRHCLEQQQQQSQCQKKHRERKRNPMGGTKNADSLAVEETESKGKGKQGKEWSK